MGKRLQQLFCLTPSPREFYFPWHKTMSDFPCYFEVFMYLHSQEVVCSPKRQALSYEYQVMLAVNSNVRL